MPFSRASVVRLTRYTAWSITLFIPEYALFLLFLKYTDIHYVVLTVGTFLFGITLQYALVRRFVFTETHRGWHTGYALFVSSSIVGAGLVGLFMVGLVEGMEIPQYIARILAGMSAGYLVYLFNVYATFKPGRSHRA